MKKLLAFSLVFTLSYILHAQRFDWVTSGGYAFTANSFIGARDIARDSDGNMYVFDSGNGAMQCQGDTIFNIAGSPTRTFIYKFNPQGELLYMKVVGNTVIPFNVETDANDNVYLKVRVLDFVDIPDDTSFTLLAQRFYVFKFDKNFKFKSSYLCGAPANATKNSMLQYSDGFIYTTKNSYTLVKLDTNLVEVAALEPLFIQELTAMPTDFCGSAVFDNGDLLFAAYNRSNVSYVEADTLFQPENPFLHGSHLLIRTDPNLNVIWAKQFNGFRNPDRYFLPVSIGNDNSVYVLGQVSSTLVVNNDTIEGNPANVGRACMYKVSGNGAGIWARPFGLVHQVMPWSILNNPDGSGVFAAGVLNGSQQFGPLNPDLSKGSAYIVKMSYSGEYQSVFTFTGASYEPLSLATNGQGVFYVGGKCQAFFNPVFSCQPRTASSGFYLAKFFEQPDLAPQPSISVNGNTLTASPLFFGTIQWFLNGEPIANANEQNYNATENGNYSVQYSYIDGCVSEASSEITPVIISSLSNTENTTVRIFPNPVSETLVISGLSNESVQIYNVLGKIVYTFKTENAVQTSVNLSPLSDGVYFLKSNRSTHKFVVKR